MTRVFAILLILTILMILSTTAQALPEGAVARLGKGGFDWGDNRTVQFSPDGTLLAVATSIGVWLYDAQTYDDLAFLETNASIYSIAFSPDGRTLASGSDYGKIKLWDVETKQLIHTFEGYKYPVHSVAFSPDGSILASGSGGTIDLWNLETKELIHTLKGGTIAFSPDGSLLAGGGYDGIKLWDVETKQLIHTLKWYTRGVDSVAFSPDGKTLASGSEHGKIQLWDIETKKLIHTLTYSALIYPVSVAFSPDGRTVASGHYTTIELWDVETKKLTHTIKGHTDYITSIAFSPDGRTLASGSSDCTIELWDIETKKLIHTIKGYTNSITSIAFSPDGRILADDGIDGIQLWDVEQRQRIGTLTENICWAVAFSPNGGLLASGNYYGTIDLWNVETKQLIHTFEGGDISVCSVAFSPDGRTLASGGGNNAGGIWRSHHTIKLWDIEERQLVYTLERHGGGVNSVAFSPDGSLLASGGDDDTIKLWDVEQGQLIDTLTGHKDWVHSVAFSPDGSLLASGSGDGTIKLWDVEQRQPIDTLKGNRYDVLSVAFSPDGSLLASGGGNNMDTLYVRGNFDDTIKLWDVETKQLIHTFEGHADIVRVVAFSPNGNLLASGSYDDTVLLWDVAQFGGEDSSPPAAVTDLAIFTLTNNSATLKWTAPGDDGNEGQANTYDIRYSTSEITDENWDDATQCTRESMPNSAGEPEEFTVTNLSPGTTYYFAMKTADEVPNWSELSNIAPGTTLPQLTPTITSVTPSSRGQGATNQNIVVTGMNFMDRADVSFSGNSITVNSTTFVSSTELIANIDVAPTAPVGFRDVIVTNPDSQTGTGKDILEVTAAPTVISTHPSSLTQGSENQNVTIEGSGFVDNLPDDTNGDQLDADFGDGITVNYAIFISSTELIANISIADDADVGTRDVTLVNGDAGVGIGVGIFTVLSGSPVSPCPATTISSEPVALKTLRQFRDNRLTTNETGQKFIRLYYQNSPAVADILLKHPMLAIRSAAILKDLMPGIHFLLGDEKGRDIVMTPLMVARIKRLFEDISEEHVFHPRLSMPHPFYPNIRSISPPVQLAPQTRQTNKGSEELVQTLSMLSNWLEEYEGMNISQIWQAIDKRKPEDFDLLRNYPNPFNPDTWIPYQLSESATVTIRIYNVSGQLIRTLHLGAKPAGFYLTKDKAAYWDGRDSLGQSVASGVYFYTLQAGDFTATRNMAIVK